MSKVRGDTLQDHLTTLDYQTSQTDDEESEDEEEEDDDEEGQGQVVEHDDNSLVVRGVDTVGGHETPNDVSEVQEFNEYPTIRKILPTCNKLEFIFLLRHYDEQTIDSTDFNKIQRPELLQKCRKLRLNPCVISQLSQEECHLMCLLHLQTQPVSVNKSWKISEGM